MCAHPHPLTQIGPHTHTYPLLIVPAAGHCARTPPAFFDATCTLSPAFFGFSARSRWPPPHWPPASLGHHHRFGMVVTSTPAARLPLPASFTTVARAGLLHTVHPPSGSPLTLAALSPNSNHRSPQPLTPTTATEPGCRIDLQSPVSSPHGPFLLCPRLC
jgi:hypothetical protein